VDVLEVTKDQYVYTSAVPVVEDVQVNVIESFLNKKLQVIVDLED
jgi:hypothetical protein